MSEHLTIDARLFGRLVDPVMPFASSDDQLPLLTAVRITRAGDWLIAAATDRYRMAFKRVPVAELGDPSPTFRALLRTTDLRRIRRLWRPTRHHNPSLTLTTMPPGDVPVPRVAVESSGPLVDFDELRLVIPDLAREDGTPYPPIEKLMTAALEATPDSPQPAAVNPSFMADLRAAQEHGEPAVFWVTHHSKPVPFTVGEDFVAAIVPVRWSTPQGARPDVSSWLTTLGQTATEPAAAAKAGA